MSYPNVIQDINDLDTKHNEEISNLNTELSDKIETIKSTYLPLSGGILSGNLRLNVGFFNTTINDVGEGRIFYNAKDSIEEFAIASYTNGISTADSCLLLRNSNSPSPGSFVLRAGNSNAEYVHLIGYPSGSLTWNGNEVVRLITSYKSGSTGYRKYSDGYIEQWGYANSIANNASVTITLPVAMTTTGYNISTNPVRGSSYVNHISAYGRTTSSFTIFNYRSYSSNTYSIGCLWYVCGY